MLEQEVNGKTHVSHVLVPKDIWDDIMAMFNEHLNKGE